MTDKALQNDQLQVECYLWNGILDAVWKVLPEKH